MHLRGITSIWYRNLAFHFNPLAPAEDAADIERWKELLVSEYDCLCD